MALVLSGIFESEVLKGLNGRRGRKLDHEGALYFANVF
jgi:hypothetical protein